MGTRLYFLHNRIWHNDPDCLMLRAPLTLDQARAWAAWIGITGQLNMISEWLPGLPDERLEVLKRCIPNHGLCARPIDLFENDPAKIWHLTSGKGAQRSDVIGMFNWSDKEPTSVTLDLGKLDLPNGPKAAYAGFDYWADKFVPPFSDVIKTDLPPSSSRIVAITPLGDRPVLVGTSRHVTQGVIDIIEQRWDSKRLRLTGKSKVVGQDPYQLRIFAPTESWRVSSATLSKSDTKADATIQPEQIGREIRITINTPQNRNVSWQIAFEKRKNMEAASVKRKVEP